MAGDFVIEGAGKQAWAVALPLTLHSGLAPIQ